MILAAATTPLLKIRRATNAHNISLSLISAAALAAKSVPIKNLLQ